MSVTFSPNIDTFDADGMNVSNTNARRILARLGIADDEWWIGDIDPDTLIAKIDAAVAEILVDDDADNGIADVTGVIPGGPTVTYCGLPAGYFARSFARLRAIAVAAKALGVDVCWA